jgi:hypothetical protein
MVGLQTLDLRIGVRVPASQPLIPEDLLIIVCRSVTRVLRRRCGLMRGAQSV